LCTFEPFAPCTLHFAVNWFCVIVFFVTIGGQLRWALCLSGNPPLCVLMLSVLQMYCCIVENKPSLSLSLSTIQFDSELSIGPFCVTRSNPNHQLTDSIQPNPVQVELAATLWWFTAAPKPLKYKFFGGHPAPRGRTILGNTTRPGHATCVLV